MKMFDMILWPIFIGMLVGFIALELTMRFRAKRKSFAVVSGPSIVLMVLGGVCAVYGALNYSYVGKSLLFLGMALVAFGCMAFATSRPVKPH